MFRVANCAKTIRPTATIQLTTIELVIGKLKGWAISTALAERPCSSPATTPSEAPGWAGVDEAVDLALHPLQELSQANEQADEKEQHQPRLQIKINCLQGGGAAIAPTGPQGIGMRQVRAQIHPCNPRRGVPIDSPAHK